MVGNLRRRGGVYWFRRRVPRSLLGRFPSGEVSHSLGTACSREAAARAKSAWLATERLFQTMSLDAALTAAQARIILQRLATEPLLDSPTSDELIASAGGGNWSALRSLFDVANHDAILALPEGDRLAVGNHMALLLERVEVFVAREAQKTAQLRLVLETLRHQRERGRANEAEAALLQSERAGSVAADVAGRLKELAAMRPLPSPDGRLHAPTRADIPRAGIRAGHGPATEHVGAAVPGREEVWQRQARQEGDQPLDGADRRPAPDGIHPEGRHGLPGPPSRDACLPRQGRQG